MDTTTVIIILVGAVQALMGIVLGFLIRAQTRAEARIDKAADDLANFKADVPIRYASDADVRRVEEAVRAELAAFTSELRTKLDAFSATLHELVGANSRRG